MYNMLLVGSAGIGFEAILIFFVVFLVIIMSGITIVPQTQAFVIKRLGKYKCTWTTGLHFKLPIIDKVAGNVNLKEQVVDFIIQPIVSKDNVAMQVLIVVYFQITDPECYVSHDKKLFIGEIENFTATTLKNIISDMKLDETLASRENINDKISLLLDVETKVWGIKVNRVELQNIISSV